ncbi:murein biosynthesis integral membrane protein MurJ [Bifidobacterium vespertilionis]|uniref:murein biosynthesis integral membrane protein MurJ n=1 Tax=Bifidobacterium vespertilionis TaxID=2562524 RepID=UPI001BDD91A4|nr:murein biosynthesis integral membrane protein MurJ [Bifidobacterium vespertilionis]MBT1178916.1 virulence factor protein [Bifidobacterium vespertilionis]
MSSVGRNSMIMAVGTFASRITGQIRQILLAAAVGTTGIAAMAYQTGSQIPQVVFNLISGGIFNAVLVPQIVRALKEEDAQDRLNKLITDAITLLIVVTGVMMLLTPWVTQLYVSSSWNGEQKALANAFTLWCMPQIFFYGLYTVLGQILAAKERFGLYAWSSVGANVVSCAGFAVFIWMFGNAAMQPVGWWTQDKIAFTAGAWTAGVAFQAVVLFVPLIRMGFHYRPLWGLRGIGLRSMGRVAVWSMALVVLNLIMGMVNSQVLTGAPTMAGDPHGVAGNASYQYAYSIQILPYSLVAVSIATAIFPKLSRSISDGDYDTARSDLSSSIRSMSLVMMYFTVVLILIPTPVTIALVPSISYSEVLLISDPLIALALNLVPVSCLLVIQRTFYAFEDGKHPFTFALLQNGVQLALLLGLIAVFPPKYWATLVAVAVTLSYVPTLPAIYVMLRKRFGGHLDGRRIMTSLGKALVAGLMAWAAGWLCQWALRHVIAFDDPQMHTATRWVLAVVECAVVSIAAGAAYAVALWALKAEEFTSIVAMAKSRLGRLAGRRAADGDGSGDARATSGPINPTGPADQSSPSGQPDRPVSPVETESVVPPSTSHSGETGFNINENHSFETDFKDDSSQSNTTIPSDTPTDRMEPMNARPVRPLGTGKNRFRMTPQPGDVLIDRYTLVKALRREPGLEAWHVNDHVLARDCQLFLVTDPSASTRVNAIASALALAKNDRFTPVLQMRSIDDVALLVTNLDEGVSLSDYLLSPAKDTLSVDAMRVIVGECALALQMLIDQRLTDRAVTTDTIRLDTKHIRIADAPVSPVLQGPMLHPDDPMDTAEALAVRQLAAVLYNMLTRRPYTAGQTYPAKLLIDVADKPHNFWIICQRGLGLPNPDGSTPTPISTLDELIALLGYWKPLDGLTDQDILWPDLPGAASIARTPVKDVDESQLLTLPDGVLTRPNLNKPKEPVWNANQLLFPERDEVEMIKPQQTGTDDLLATLGDPSTSVLPQNKPTQAVDVSAIRPIRISDVQVPDIPFVEAPIVEDHASVPDAAAAPKPAQPLAGLAKGVPGDSTEGDTENLAQERAEALEALKAARAEGAAQAGQAASDDLIERAGAINTLDAAAHVGETASPRLADLARSTAASEEDLTEKTTVQEPVSIESEQAMRPMHVESAPPSFLPGEYGPHRDAYAGSSAAAGSRTGSGAGSRARSGADAGVDPNADDISNESNSVVFGKMRTRSFVIVLGTLFLVVALVLSMSQLFDSAGSLGFKDPAASQWPTDLDNARFPGRETSTSAAPSSGAASESGSASASANTEEAVDHSDRDVEAAPVPAPVPTPTNTTPYPITTSTFLSRPARLNGYGRYIKLDAPHDVYKVEINIRQSSGSGQVFVNSNAQNPNNGAPVGTFTIDANGSATVQFEQPVNTQEIVIWFPTGQLPSGGRLTFQGVNVY